MIGKDKMKRYRPFRFLFLKEKTFSVANLYKKYRNGLAVYGKNFIGSLPLCFFNWTKDARNGGDRPPCRVHQNEFSSFSRQGVSAGVKCKALRLPLQPLPSGWKGLTIENLSTGCDYKSSGDRGCVYG